MGIGQPSERELMCLYRAKLWEGLIPFTELFEEHDRAVKGGLKSSGETPDPASNFEEPDDERSNDNQQGPVAQMVERLPCKQGVDGSIPVQDLQRKKRPKPEYDWRVVVANARRT